jgi:HD-like signal output (HDOD) protein
MASPQLPLTRESMASLGGSIPAFPKVAMEMLGLLGNDQTNLRLLVDYARLDAVIAGQLIGIANAAGSRPGREPVRDLQSAIAMIGLQRVRQLVMSVSILGAFRHMKPGDMLGDYWEHSIDVGTCAQVLAEYMGVDPDRAYVSGLIHDVGQLWLAHNYPDAFARVAAMRRTSPEMEQIEAERQIFGMDHAQVGGVLGEMWKLPALMAAATRDHHGSAGMDRDPHVLLIHLAQNICEALGLESDPIHYVSPDIENVLHPDWDAMHLIYGEIEARARLLKAEVRAMAG